MTNYQKKYLKYKKKYLEAKKIYGGETLEELIKKSIITNDIYFNLTLDDKFFQMALVKIYGEEKAEEERKRLQKREKDEGLSLSDDWRFWADEKNKEIKMYELQAFKNKIEKKEISCVAEVGKLYHTYHDQTHITPEAAEKIVTAVTKDRFNYIDDILIDLTSLTGAAREGKFGEGVKIVAEVTNYYHNHIVPHIDEKKDEWLVTCKNSLSKPFVSYWDTRQKDN